MINTIGAISFICGFFSLGYCAYLSLPLMREDPIYIFTFAMALIMIGGVFLNYGRNSNKKPTVS